MAAFALPLDEIGQITPHNHPDLSDAVRMLRGVAQRHIVPDANYGCDRLSSALFKNCPRRQDYLSFNSEACIGAAGENSAKYMSSRGWLGVVCMTVGKFRTFDPAKNAADTWKIGMVPLPDEEPPDLCHGGVWGKITQGKANEIRREVGWLVEIPGVVLDETKLR